MGEPGRAVGWGWFWHLHPPAQLLSGQQSSDVYNRATEASTVSSDGMSVAGTGCPLQPENTGKQGFLFRGRWFAFSYPLLRLHCDTNLNQSVPKKKEKYPTLLLQPFHMSCPGSDFAKSVVLGSAGQFVSYPPRERAPGCTSCWSCWSRTRVCSGTHTCVLGDHRMCIPTCSHVSPAWPFIAGPQMLPGHYQDNPRYQRTLRKWLPVAKACWSPPVL